MKTKKPKARVMWADQFFDATDEGEWITIKKGGRNAISGRLYDRPVAVLPCPTKKQAQHIVRFFNKTEEERVEEIVKNADAHSFKRGVYGNYWNPDCARAIHALIFGGTEK